MEVTQSRDILENGEVMRRAAFWSKKYQEDRTKTVEQRQRIIAERLMVEFDLHRSLARKATTYATRDWA